MKSKRTKKFRKLFNKLPANAKKDVKAAFKHFDQDPYYPSLQFKCIEKRNSGHSIRIGLHYRAIGYMEGNEITWDWVGTHAEYDHCVY